MIVLGVDFTSHPRRGKPITCLSCILDRGVLRADRLEEWQGFGDFGGEDFKRGQFYGRMTIAAMQRQGKNYGGYKLALSIVASDLEQIIEGMIKDGIERCKKGGRESRTPTTSAMNGFLSEISRHVAGIESELPLE